MNDEIHGFENEFSAADLPRGTYHGEWSGYVLQFGDYTISTSNGPRGRVPVIVTVTDDRVSLARDPGARS